MIGTIGISELKVNCIIGIHPHERENPQTLMIDIKVTYDLEKAASTENIHHTIDYTLLAKIIEDLGIQNKYQLMETFAEDIAKTILEKFHITSISIAIKKPQAIVNAAYAFVEVTRFQSPKK